MTLLPLEDVTVIDLSTLLPGPLATLYLAEAGARVIKVERPPDGDEMRFFPPAFGESSASFLLLNRGKQSVSIDLKTADGLEEITELLKDADILVEQFRPGVLTRLGLGPEMLQQVNPRLITCSITGFGQTGPRAAEAGHDLTYMAASGLLSLARGADGAPVVPATLNADIAGGAWPAVMNILLALRQRDRSGRGLHLDIPMADNLFPLAFMELARGYTGDWPAGGDGLLTGGSPRYAIYRTADNRFLAAAPLEQRFWDRFCDLTGLPDSLRNDVPDPAATKAAVAVLIAQRTAAEWQERFAGQDVCCAVVASLQEAVGDPAFASRGLFARSVRDTGGNRLPALPLPLDPSLRDNRREVDCPEEQNSG
ncbi:MAG: CaiB/BaiF CoA-transferase family protein [Rhodospirillales bacterium]